MQGAAVKKCSSMHTTFLLREAIAHCTENGNTAYVALLDLEKAFDMVWINGLLYKLYKLGIDPVIWRLLKNSYTGFVC